MEKRFGNIYMKRFLYFNLYVIKGRNGDILIDTGFIGMKKSLKKWLDNFNIKLVILTHAHVDHIWNTAYLKELYNCKVAISKDDIDNLDNRNIHSKPMNSFFKLWAMIMNLGMRLFKQKDFDVDIFLNDKDVIKKYGLTFKIYSLKGHTNGSIGIKYKDYLFIGDALVNRGKYPTIAFQNQNNEDALDSLNKNINLKPKIIFVGHDKEFNYDKLKKY